MLRPPHPVTACIVAVLISGAALVPVLARTSPDPIRLAQQMPSPTPPAPPAAAPPVASPPAAAPATGDQVDSAVFGEEVTLVPRPALIITGTAPWDDLYGTFRRAIEQLRGIANAQGVVIAGAPQVRFVSSTDDQIAYEALLPVAIMPGQAAERFQPAQIGATPGGRAMRFVHQGAYDTIEQTYDEIAGHLDERNIVAEDAFVEEYIRDPDTTPETDLATFIYVFPRAQ
jgi:effector-binding domain-containing protein